MLTEDTSELVGEQAGPMAQAAWRSGARNARGESGPRRSSRGWTRGRSRERQTLELAVDTARLHFFDPETGLGIYEDGA